VKYYVWYNLILVAITSAIAVISEVKSNSLLSNFYVKHQLALYVLSLGIMLVLFLIFWIFYRLIYGILLRKLYKNYNELKKIDL
jgi:uncharacterized membrane protein